MHNSFAPRRITQNNNLIRREKDFLALFSFILISKTERKRKTDIDEALEDVAAG